MAHVRTALVAAALAAVLAPATAGAAVGDLDTSFGGTGSVAYNAAGLTNSFARDVVLQADGKILLAGYAQSTHGADFAVMRLNPDGSVDSEFGQGGTTLIDFDPNLTDSTTYNDFGSALAMQPSGKIVVVGTSQDDVAVARLNTNGTLDTSFNPPSGNGKFVRDLVALDQVADVAILADGRILVAGSVDITFNGNTANFFALGLSANGNLDTTFGDGGVRQIDFGAQDIAHAIAVAPGGGIFIAGGTEYSDSSGTSSSFAVTRLDASGNIDTGFGSFGLKTWTAAGSYSTLDDLAVQLNGDAVVGGLTSSTSTQVGIVGRLHPDGTFDQLDGHDMKPITFGNPVDSVSGVAVDPHGRILVSGNSNTSTGAYPHSAGLARLNPDGSFDTSLGGDGTIAVFQNSGPSGGRFGAAALALQADGRIVLGGVKDRNFWATRFLGDPTAPPAGGGTGGSGGGSGPPAKDTSAPALSGLKVSASRWRAGTGSATFSKAARPPVGMTVSWRLSEAAKVTLHFDSSGSGRLVGRTCRPPNSANRKRRRCTLYRDQGSLTRSLQAGSRKLRFSGRISVAKRLKPGRYRLRLDAVDAAGNRARTRTVSFTIVS